MPGLLTAMATARYPGAWGCDICTAVFSTDRETEASVGCQDCHVLLCKPCAEEYAQHEPSLKCPQCRGQAADQPGNAVCIVKDALSPRVQCKLNVVPGMASHLIQVFSAVGFKINPALHCYEPLLGLLPEIPKLGGEYMTAFFALLALATD